jgi:SAM-dependent methyltransferase
MQGAAPAAPAAYLTDVPYLRHFCKELAPPMLRAAAALNGFSPPPDDAFDYCELGCGPGDTLATLAAASPQARFVGVDFSAAHIAAARALAASGGLGNVRLLEMDFGALSGEPLPDFDYVCANGVLSWIAPETRRAIFELAAARLKPGGVLAVSYNALPGWAAIAPLRRLLQDTSAAVEGTSLDRARYGLAMAKLFCDAGAEYFTSHPSAREMVDTMLRLGPTYVAHEYLGSEWHPLYFADVAAEAGACGLRFAGQVPLYLNYRDLVIPIPARDLFHRMTDRAAYEALKDFAINEFFRRDLYVKGATHDEASTRDYMATTRFGTLAPATRVKREVRLRHHTLRYEGALFDALLDRLTERASTVAELAADPSLTAFGTAPIQDAVLRLLLGEQAAPMRANAPAVPRAYNTAILEQPLSPTHPAVLSSPVAGTGVALSQLEAVSLRVLTQVLPADRDRWLLALVAAQPLRLLQGERLVEDPRQKVRILATEVDRFRRERLAKAVELGLVDRTD